MPLTSLETCTPPARPALQCSQNCCRMMYNLGGTQQKVVVCCLTGGVAATAPEQFSVAGCWLVGQVRLGERSSGSVFGGNNGGGCQRPLDSDCRIVPQDSAFRGGCVEIGGFVEHIGGLRQNQEAMGETGRYPEHFRRVRAELDTHPLTKMGGRTANVDRNVKDSASHGAHQFALRMLQLKVEASQDMLA